MKIDYLTHHHSLIPQLAQQNSDMWGYHDLANTPDKKAEHLLKHADSHQRPHYFIAVDDGKLLGSVGLIVK